MLARTIMLLVMAIGWSCSQEAPSPAFAQVTLQPPHRPTIILGRKHPGRITAVADDGVVVDLRNGNTQVVQFSEIWRIRRAFASDEPVGTTVIDFANNRLFVATPLADLIGNAGKRIPLAKLTAPNGEIVYMAANKVTDIFNALPGVHNPASQAVVGTRDGTQQVLEAVDAAKQSIAQAHVTQ